MKRKTKSAESWPFPWKFERARYPDLYLMQRVTEAEVQRNVLALLHSYSVDAIAIDAGGRRARGRMMAAAKSSGISLSGVAHAKTGGGIPAGFADLEATLAPGGRALYIEIKAPAWLDGDGRIVRAAGQASAEQIEFLFSKFARGAFALVAWSPTDVEHFLGAALAMNRLELTLDGAARRNEASKLGGVYTR
jgi:hypothetical protein